ncbi:uroporphyrinogen-III C-methyltransferase [Litchfieldia alkalitelluris]|uniref:uroporphyrinogen-III C-methyltransferase n=1 Tax=Litchfieldia alkalitelluris TaxID=304268 RepID=UPI0009972469|nr:uroporphyrinogen-III C-methyltransferase [Litchfieldia alkalitelluris]
MGKAYLVGAGPGDPELITLKGMKCIQLADVILYDRLVNKELLSYAKEGSELVFCGKSPECHTLQQERINELLVEYVKQGKIVTRLKGGDPFVFGRGAEEAEVLYQNKLQFEIVPGITSAIAAAAYAGIPVTHRELSSSFAFVAGHRKNFEEDVIKWESLAKGVDTIAIYMGVKNLPFIQKKLVDYGKPSSTPVAVINWGTTTHQRTVIGTLDNISDVVKREKIENPCMIIVGEVVKMRNHIKWFEELKPVGSSEGEN